MRRPRTKKHAVGSVRFVSAHYDTDTPLLVNNRQRLRQQELQLDLTLVQIVEEQAASAYPLRAKVGPVLEIQPLDEVLHPLNHAPPVVCGRFVPRLFGEGNVSRFIVLPPPPEIGRVLHVPREK